MTRDEWKFTVTFFGDRSARVKRQVEMSAPDLVDQVGATSAPTKGALPWLKLAIFGDQPTDNGSLRHDGNVQFLTGVMGDYDGEKVDLNEAADLLYAAEVEAILYSSPSSTPSRPRWRVVCPFLNLMVLPDVIHGRMLGRVNGVLGGILAPESWTLSQAYYYGRALDNSDADFRVIHVGGQPVDNLHELQDRAIGKPGTSGGFIDGGRGGGGPAKSADYWRSLLGDVEKGRHDGSPARNAALASIAGALLRDGIDDEQYRMLLQQYDDRHCKPPLKRRVVAQIATSVENTHRRRAGR
jgi:hypothetical protein